MTIIFSLSVALSNVFYIRCDSSVLNRLKDISSWNNVWIVVVEHGMPLLAFNTFAFTAILLGFLWARQSYTAHSHNNIVFGYKATYWAMIEASMGHHPPEMPYEQWIEMRAEMFKEVMKVSPASGYGEGTQAIQLIGMSAGETMIPGMMAGKGG